MLMVVYNIFKGPKVYSNKILELVVNKGKGQFRTKIED